jgi:hypothetical protein
MVGFILDCLRDCADIWSEVNASDRISWMQDVTDKLDKLRQVGLSCFAGSLKRPAKVY